ncbi:MAG: cbb3-type cytochrome oxidase assembly protein CcoS [bacterium]|jgi:cbb3-type cytochrome oxidase maturation protein|nr:cbb3-type cytochrome oxidase assembly protein CcoS [bacterium]MBK7048791.1 cbb3-type cytochrome oxidase assembly protein CcoS [bacterium]MBK7189100.1 cbb3-type cytochrome oxidase assembly protein CcoS [bacterium]MBK7770824.1 cbb3-type cytochrome oxidase assembly protein CcoS [bacterium]MBK9470881.1 cbb3-type cytochrome oxidase assembly protein CcoS [bacterium]
MDVIIVLVFFSLSLVIAGLIFFFTRLRDGDFDHEERLSILPLADDDGSKQDNRTKEVDPRNGDDKLDRLGSNAAGDERAPTPPA